MPTSNSDIVQNEFVITAEDLEFGNAIALCFVGHADFVNRLRTQYGMGGRAIDGDEALRVAVGTHGLWRDWVDGKAKCDFDGEACWK